MTTPRITIITITRNAGNTLEKTIQSVIAQQYSNLEYIIIDGASSDNTLDIINQYSSHITYWHSKPDKGANDAYNIAIQLVTGDIVAILNGDDWYEPNTLKAIANAFIENPTADMFTCGGRIVSYDAKNQSYIPQLIYADAEKLKLTFKNICFGASVICCRFFRKPLLDKLEGFLTMDKHGKHMFSADKELLMRAVLLDAKDVYVDYLGHNYLAHEGSSTFGNNRNNIIKLCQEHMEIAEALLAGENISYDQRATLKSWYYDQALRLTAYQLLEKNLGAAFKIIQQAFSKSPIQWLAALLTTPCRVIAKRASDSR